MYFDTDNGSYHLPTARGQPGERLEMAAKRAISRRKKAGFDPSDPQTCAKST